MWANMTRVNNVASGPIVLKITVICDNQKTKCRDPDCITQVSDVVHEKHYCGNNGTYLFASHFKIYISRFCKRFKYWEKTIKHVVNEDEDFPLFSLFQSLQMMT
jgi:hypothetical protein